MLLKRPDDFDDLDDERKAEIKYQIFKLTLFQLYFIETEEKNPILAKRSIWTTGKRGVCHWNMPVTHVMAILCLDDSCDDDDTHNVYFLIRNTFETY